MFITASAFFLIKAIEEKKFIFTYTSVVLGSIASAVRFVSFPYSVALFAYVSLTSILKKERYFLTGITIFSGACLIFLPYLFFHANPLYHISQNADAYSPDKFNSKYIFGWNFIPFFVEGQVKNYVQAFLHDWWGDWFRYYKHYNNSLMWKVHLLMGHVATIFIFASIVTYFIMKSMSISSLNAFKMATTEIDAFFTLYLLLWLAGIAYFSVSYANPGMYVLKAVYFAQGLPALIFLCLKGTEKLRINNTFFASMSLVFFIQSIYTHLLVP